MSAFENASSTAQTSACSPETKFVMPVPKTYSYALSSHQPHRHPEQFSEMLHGIPSDRISDEHLTVYPNNLSTKVISFSNLFLENLEFERQGLSLNLNKTIYGRPIASFPKPLVLEVRTKGNLKENFSQLLTVLDTEYGKASLVFKPEVATFIQEKIELFLKNMQVLQNKGQLRFNGPMPNFTLSSYAFQSDEDCTFCLIRLNYEGLSSTTFAIGLEKKQGVFVISQGN